MKEKFIAKAFAPESEVMIAQLNKIIDDYAAKGYRLSLRQLYYQLVARDLTENTVQAYKRIGDLVSNARLAGRIDWAMIEDRNRETIVPPMWESPAQIVEAAASQFAIDRWKDQNWHVEVMVEKAALEGVLIPVCRKLGIRFSANRGYSSSSAMYETGKRLARMSGIHGKSICILYLGDHDPSGIDMTRDVLERLELFSGGYQIVDVKRLALNMDQVEALHPPENPAKTTDSRAEKYIAEFGESSWELDAVSPEQLDQLVTDAVIALRDEGAWQHALAAEDAMKKELQGFAKSYRSKHYGEDGYAFQD
jgi:hypothetical protein